MPQRERGELGTFIMNVLWDASDGATGNDVLAAFPDPKPAMTTVLTVLTRLLDKGLIRREKQDGRGYRYFATTPRTDTLVNDMVRTLTASPDRSLTLLNFAGNLTDEDREVLRRALGKQ
jgi:predicted transcriptional regulator